jgi:hypothetical protein
VVFFPWVGSHERQARVSINCHCSGIHGMGKYRHLGVQLLYPGTMSIACSEMKSNAILAGKRLALPRRRTGQVILSSILTER